MEELTAATNMQVLLVPVSNVATVIRIGRRIFSTVVVFQHQHLEKPRSEAGKTQSKAVGGAFIVELGVS